MQFFKSKIFVLGNICLFAVLLVLTIGFVVLQHDVRHTYYEDEIPVTVLIDSKVVYSSDIGFLTLSSFGSYYFIFQFYPDDEVFFSTKDIYEDFFSKVISVELSLTEDEVNEFIHKNTKKVIEVDGLPYVIRISKHSKRGVLLYLTTRQKHFSDSS